MSVVDIFVVVLVLHLVALAFTKGDDRRFLTVMCTVVSVGLAVMCTVVSVGLTILHELEKLTG